jgi:hypothetical protein
MMLIITPRRLTGALALLAAGALLYKAPTAMAWQPAARASFWVLVLTAGAALWYSWLTYRLLRGQQTPTLVVAYENGQTVVRNFGQGAALNISLTTDTGQTLGRASDLSSGGTGTVTARWHGTKCLGQAISPAVNIPVASQVLGRVFNPPPAVRRVALVRSAVEHWVQLYRTWDPRNWVRRGAHALRKRRAENRIIGLIRHAKAAGWLGEIFTALDVSNATELERVVADRFLPNHTVGNAGGEREFFVEDSAGRYRLK